MVGEIEEECVLSTLFLAILKYSFSIFFCICLTFHECKTTGWLEEGDGCTRGYPYSTRKLGVTDH